MPAGSRFLHNTSRALVIALAGALPYAVQATEQPRKNEDQAALRLEVGFEGRDEGGVDVSRLRLDTSLTFKPTKDSELYLLLPYSKVTLETGGVKSTATGLEDIAVEWKKTLRKPKPGKNGSRLYLGASLPTGKTELDASEARAVEAISPSAEGWEDPGLGAGFDLTVGYGILVSPSRTASLEYRASYTLRGDYDSTDTVNRQVGDSFRLEVRGRYDPSRRRADDFKVAAVFGFDETVVQLAPTGPGPGGGGTTRTAIDAWMDLELSYDHVFLPAKGRRRSLSLAFLMRDTKDYITAQGTVLPRVNLGDRLSARATFGRRKNGGWLDFGLLLQRTEKSEDADTGATILDSKRSELALVVDVEGPRKNGGGLDATVQVGLNDDARDLVFTAGWTKRF